MRREKGTYHVLVFAPQDGAGRVDERAARFNVPCAVFQNGELQSRQLCDLVRVLVARFRLFADDAEARARHIAQHGIRALRPLRAERGGVLKLGADVRQAEPRGALLNALQLVLVDVARGQAALPLHFLRHREALAAGGGAAVEDGRARLWVGDERRERTRRVLHGDASRAERVGRGRVAARAQQDVRERAVRRDRHPGALELGLRLVRRSLHSVDAHRDRRVGVVRLTDALGQLLTELLGEQAHEPFGMAVPERVVALLVRAVEPRQRVLFDRLRRLAHDGVRERYRAVVCVAVALDERHGLRHRRVRRDFIHENQLIQSHAQTREHSRRDLFKPQRGKPAQIPVEQQLVLHRAVGQTRGERGVPAVQTGAGEIMMQRAVRPRALLRHGKQRKSGDLARRFGSFIDHRGFFLRK